MTLPEALAWTDYCEDEVNTPSPAPEDIERDIDLEQRSAIGLLHIGITPEEVRLKGRSKRSWLSKAWQHQKGD